MGYPEAPDPITKKARKHQLAAKIPRWPDLSDAEIKPSNQKRLVGYRFQQTGAIRSGRAGVFYTQSPQGRGDKKFTLNFNNILEVPTEKVAPFVGLPAEYLASVWFPDRTRNDWDSRAMFHNVEEDGHAMDIDVAREAVRRGYDGIKYGEFEIQDLKPLT